MDQPVVGVERDEQGGCLVDHAQIEKAKAAARRNSTGRARINAHPSLDSETQEMFIAFVRGSYVRPHRHSRKRESFHVVQGLLDAVSFDDEGRVTKQVRLGTFDSGHPFYFRSEVNDWHCFIVRSKIAVVHETTQGPFEPGESEFPTWAPDPEDIHEVQAFLKRLSQ